MDNLSKITYIVITTEFWSDKKQNSYLVLTGHYVDDQFKKQLTELQIFDKVTTITCDGAPNIVGFFDYFSRTGIWLKKVTVIQESDTNMIDIDEHLSQIVRTIKINEDIEDEQEEGDDNDDDEQDDIEECNQGDSELESATADRSTSDQQSDEDESEDEESDLEDNFQYGVNTDDDNNILPIEIDQRVGDFLFLCRGLIDTINGSAVLSFFI
ncbi:unnamed protein product [Rotaria sordida]|uniref:Uncharacterized protein n=1 Tax=Rotaria sordida TaxID=392033 RepID=A0A814RMP7_9BILA|nr:unnamed protein product [Rotaria sordida]CAF1361080.1 unnamed protein product [Rotaria sordida]